MQAWWRRARHTHACTHVLAACLRTRGQACLRPWPPSTPSAAAAATSSAAAAARLAAAARRSAQTAPRLTGRHQPGRCAAAPPPPCVCGRGGTGRGGAGQGRAAGQRGGRSTSTAASAGRVCAACGALQWPVWRLRVRPAASSDSLITQPHHMCQKTHQSRISCASSTVPNVPMCTGLPACQITTFQWPDVVSQMYLAGAGSHRGVHES